MAIAKLAAPLAGLRGTVGGVVYSANKSGPYVRSWYQSAKGLSVKQSVTRETFTLAPLAWNALTSSQRSDWQDWADLPAQEKTNALGEGYYCSGFQWFVSCYMNLALVGGTLPTDAPTEARPSAPGLTSLSASASPIAITLYWATPELEGFYMPFFANLTSSTVRTVQYPNWRYAGKKYDTTATQTSITANLANLYGTAREGQHYWIKAYKMTTEGVQSAPAVVDTVAT